MAARPIDFADRTTDEHSTQHDLPLKIDTTLLHTRLAERTANHQPLATHDRHRELETSCGGKPLHDPRSALKIFFSPLALFLTAPTLRVQRRPPTAHLDRSNLERLSPWRLALPQTHQHRRTPMMPNAKFVAAFEFAADSLTDAAARGAQVAGSRLSSAMSACEAFLDRKSVV